VRGQLATAQAAAQAAAEELVAARSQCQAASADAKSIRAAGVKLYKQVGADWCTCIYTSTLSSGHSERKDFTFRQGLAC
jgi:hypothetical protein